jgi:LmbE family N-acetylglucosaminyl deacetylase
MDDIFSILTLDQPFVVLAPHPDDEILGAAGLMMEARSRGLEFGVAILTDGAASHPDASASALAATRRLETQRGLDKLLDGPVPILFCDIHDGQLVSQVHNETLHSELAQFIRERSAQTLIVTDPADNHPDHKATFGLAARLVAGGACNQLTTMRIGQRLDGNGSSLPFHTLQLGGLGEQKAKAIAAHKSQSPSQRKFGAGFVLTSQMIEPFLNEEHYRIARGGDGSSAAIPATHFDILFSQSDDPWGYRDLPYEWDRFDQTLKMLQGQHFKRALELGCANGELTRRLAPLCASLLSVDHSVKAVEHARPLVADIRHVNVVCASIPKGTPHGLFDLIVLSDMLYYLGFDGVAELISQLNYRSMPGTALLMANYLGATDTALTGEMAAEMSIALLTNWAVVNQHRSDLLRIDLLERTL